MANTTFAASLPGLTTELKELIRTTAIDYGIDPVDLAMAMHYESAGTFDPDQWGGTGGIRCCRPSNACAFRNEREPVTPGAGGRAVGVSVDIEVA
ncbi:MAG: hypothetical protein KIT43_10455 [Bauldia sp.]|nr:hypothetical protein [Bauldia sp.]MCW5717733.1 hypothetical protein [Bauldia sp.]